MNSLSRRRGLAAASFTLLSYGAALAGRLLMRGRPNGWWYRVLRKPSYQPPSWVFPPVWTFLYGCIAYAGYRVFRASPSPMRTAALGLWGTQLTLNAAWTPLFFGAHRGRAALVDTVALDLAVLSFAGAASRVDRRAAAATAPYAAWLGLATALNASIVARNPRVLVG